MSTYADVDFWRQLCPQLSVTTNPAVPSIPQIQDRDRHADQLRKEGYFKLDAALARLPLDRLATGFSQIKQAGLPLQCILLYDEALTLLASLRPLLRQVLKDDYRLTDDIRFFHLEPGLGRGYPPHRDGRWPNLVAPDGLPQVMSAWVALSDVPLESACLHVLPADRDSRYPDGAEQFDPSIPEVYYDGADIRPLPVPAGSVIGISPYLAHWGGACRPDAPGPRVSLTAYLQRGAPEPDFTWEPGQAEGLERRFGLIASAPDSDGPALPDGFPNHCQEVWSAR